MSLSRSSFAIDLPVPVPTPPGWSVGLPDVSLLPVLTRREREILPLLAARWTDKEIADVLCISHRTVTTHVTHIYEKLGIHSRRSAAAYLWAVAQASAGDEAA